VYKTGDKIHWHPIKNKFINNSRANDLIKANYHKGWQKAKIS
jgi:hypothetical protein